MQAIRDFGFKTSPYPLILSLDVHCSVPQQDRMAHILRTELGELLQLPPPGLRRKEEVGHGDGCFLCTGKHMTLGVYRRVVVTACRASYMTPSM